MKTYWSQLKWVIEWSIHFSMKDDWVKSSE